MEEEYTEDEALQLVRNMVFPAAQDGDTVEQFGYWFILENGTWNVHAEQHINNDSRDGQRSIKWH